MPRSIVARPLLSLIGLAALLLPAAAQGPGAVDRPLLREAGRDEAWITHPTIGAPPPGRPAGASSFLASITDSTAPTAPGSLVVEVNGLFRILARWAASTDAESGIDYYAFALGTGTTTATEANVRWWQSTGTGTSATISMALTEGAMYYLSVRANNGANMSSAIVRSGPLVPARIIYGGAANAMSYQIASTGIGAGGETIPTWTPARVAELSEFMDKMLPVLKDLYGPPSTTYTVRLIRDLRYVTSAIFFPSADEIHAGDSVTYQLLTHELIHALRRDRGVASNSEWQYDPTLSGFEEGFAQAVSYDAMTEFARRYPSFGLSGQLFESSHAWDYDFQNVPQLRTTDFWSDLGGMNLHYMRYEVAAAAVAKIEIERPGFYKAFNAEYYRRLNAGPLLTPTRALMKEIVQAVAPTIEGLPASEWIDRQYVFECRNYVGRKLWLRSQHYPTREYFIFSFVHLYETFTNGSDWAIPLSGGGYQYHRLNGTTGTGTLTNSAGSVIWQQARQITPADNPPAFLGFGSDEVHLTTQATNQPWPGGDESKFVTAILPLDLYRLTATFTVSGSQVSDTFYRVMGAPLRNTTGVFGGVLGASGGRILLRHRSYSTAQRTSLTAEAFWLTAPWASLDHPATQSNDTVPGVIDVVYIDGAGTAYSAVRDIGIGSWNGNQAFLFDVSRMTAGGVAPLVMIEPRDQTAIAGGTAVFTVEGDGPGALSYQWQRRPAGSGTFANLAASGSYAGTTSPSLSVTAASGMAGDAFRCVITNQAGSTTTVSAALAVSASLTITSNPVNATRVAGQSATFSVAAVGVGPLSYQWQRRAAGSVSFVPLSTAAPYSGVTSTTLTVVAASEHQGDQFRCAVTDSQQSATTSAAALSVVTPPDAPSITSSPASVSITGPGTATFSVTATGSGPLTYKWQRQPSGSSTFVFLADDGGGFSGADTRTVSVAATPPMSGDLYRAVVSNTAGSATSGSGMLTVVSAPVITVQPADQIVARGGDPRFVVTASGTQPLSYRWQRRTPGEAGFSDLVNGGVYAGVTARDLGVTSELSFSGHQFRCVITNSLGSATSTTATLTVGTVPVLDGQPVNKTAAAGQNAIFTVAASGMPAPMIEWQASSNGGAAWAAVSDGARFSGAGTPTLTVTRAPVTLNGLRVRAKASNMLGAATSGEATLVVTVSATAAPAALSFGATRGPGEALTGTGRQFVALEFGGTAADWTAVADQPWLRVTPGAGDGAGRFGVQISDPGAAVSGTLTGKVTVTAPSMNNSPVTINVTLTIVADLVNAPPTGAVDTPADNAANLTGSVAVTGWALDDIEVTRVRIVRDPVPGEPAGVPIHLGDAAMVDGARPDVAAVMPGSPRNTRAGWGYLLLTNFLPGQGTGTYTLHAYADDGAGHSTRLGTRTITCTNIAATAPFGAIDTPAQGETVSGIVNNFGWVLSPGFRRADPPGGGTVTVYVDGVAVGSPAGWASRADLLQLFPAAQYSGINYALAVFTFDSTLLSNGVHTISWVVTDNNGEATGVGSRYFTVANGASLQGVTSRPKR